MATSPAPGTAQPGPPGSAPAGPGTARPGTARPGPWQALVRLSARTPLRIKLIAALLALVIAALAGISVAAAFVLSNYLHTNADHQVTKLFYDFEQRAQAGVLPPGSDCFGPYMDAFVAAGSQLRPCSIPSGSPPRLPGSGWLKAHSGQLVTLPAQAGSSSWRVLTRQVQYQTQLGALSGTLVAGEDLGNINQTIGRLVSIDLIVGVIVVAGLAVLGVAMVRASLQPLVEIERTAGEIAAGDLTRRVDERDPGTEVGRLGQSLNAMLAQIEAAFRAQAQSEATARWSESRMRQFAADASHELRTPLTAIRGFAEYYRQRGGLAANGSGELTREDLDRIMHRVEDEATRMGLLVEDLLLLARIDQERPLDRRPVDLLALAADAVQDASMIAPNRDVRLTVGHDTAFLVMGDEARLRQVVANLVNNALTHTPDGSPIEVRVSSGMLGSGWVPPPPAAQPETSGPAAASSPARTGWPGAGWAGAGRPGAGRPGTGAGQPVVAVTLEVVDHGPGLAGEQAERVFERFYRADQARTRKTGGTGLGLAIVAALVKAHGGTVSVDSEPGRGATFRVAIPLAPEAQEHHISPAPDFEEDPGPPFPGGQDHPGPAGPQEPAGPWGQPGPQDAAEPGGPVGSEQPGKPGAG